MAVKFNPQSGVGETFIGVDNNGQKVESRFHKGDYCQGPTMGEVGADDLFHIQWLPADTYIEETVQKGTDKYGNVVYRLINGAGQIIAYPPTVLKSKLENVCWDVDGYAILRITYLGKRQGKTYPYHNFAVSQDNRRNRVYGDA